VTETPDELEVAVVAVVAVVVALEAVAWSVMVIAAPVTRMAAPPSTAVNVAKGLRPEPVPLVPSGVSPSSALGMVPMTASSASFAIGQRFCCWSERDCRAA